MAVSGWLIAEDFTADGEGLLVVGAGGGEVAHGLQQDAQVVEAGGGDGGAPAEDFTVDGEGLLEVGAGGGVVAHGLKQVA